MSFRIDLPSKEGVWIYLVVINDQINVNFEANDPSKKYLAAQMRDKFTHLLSAHASLDHIQPMVRGEDAEHVKRHHGIKEETHVLHMHYSFDQDVTPELLQHFFDQLLLAQKSPDHVSDQFISEKEVAHIVPAFTSFYAEFKGSTLEKDFLKERELTTEEKNSLVKHAKQERTSHLSKRDVSELEKCGFSSSEIPKPIEQPTLSSFNEMELFIQLLGLLSQGRNSVFSGPTPGFFQSSSREMRDGEDLQKKPSSMF